MRAWIPEPLFTDAIGGYLPYFCPVAHVFTYLRAFEYICRLFPLWPVFVILLLFLDVLMYRYGSRDQRDKKGSIVLKQTLQ
jgi:hypothetical protein